MARAKKRENTRKVLVTLTEEAIEKGKILAVKDRTSFSEYVEELILKAKEKPKLEEYNSELGIYEEVIDPELALFKEESVGRLPRVEPKRSFKKEAPKINKGEE